jgi:hypothetical protein
MFHLKLSLQKVIFSYCLKLYHKKSDKETITFTLPEKIVVFCVRYCVFELFIDLYLLSYRNVSLKLSLQDFDFKLSTIEEMQDAFVSVLCSALYSETTVCSK